jgi:pyruvate dehydrogenase E2 component (dihydrolipoamide acetyltransferase)
MVSGTGDGGAITRADVERAADDGTAVAARSTIVTAPATAPATTPAPVPDPHEKTTSAMRDAIGAAMSRSKREIPHYYLSQEMDVARMMGWLHDVNAARPVTERVLPIAVLLSAVAHALPQFQDFNGQFSHGTFRASASVHLGVAVTMHGGGLIAPALRDAECLSTSALMPALLDLVARARTARLRTSELTDATITVTALAEGGVRELYGVIYPPQVAIVGFGAIAERPWAINGLLGVRQTVVATLAADHRVSDGHRGALFLAEIQRLLRSPEAL